MLSVEEITVRFGEVVAVDGVSLEVPAGETVALLGPSGCGKSTLLRAIAGLQPIESGTIRFADADLTGLEPHERDIGLMFQSHALFPHRDVGRNIAFGLAMRSWPKPEQRARVAEMLRLVGLDGYEGRRVDRLSGGEAQRVALARALAPSPSVLLLDEPFGSLDRILRDRLAIEVRELLRELRQTAVHVTHDHDEAVTVASWLAVMDGGRILRAGPTEEVLADPGHPTVVSLLGL